jgi:transcriptional regulator with XRE-family HTH domain
MARRREAGIELRAQRELCGLSSGQLAGRTSSTQAMISQWERGKRPIKPEDAAYLLGLYKTPMPDADRILELLKPPSDLYWVRPYLNNLVNPLKSLIIQENLAETITNFEPLRVPGLLQTEPYARTLFELGGRTAGERMELLIKVRMDRQKLLQRHAAPHCTFYIHERALRPKNVEPAVMHEQLQYLVLTTNLPNCTIRVVPESAKPFTLLDDSFTTMSFIENPAHVYVDTYTAGIFVDDQVAVEAYCVVVAQLEQAALGEGQSREWLTRQAGEYERMKE